MRRWPSVNQEAASHQTPGDLRVPSSRTWRNTRLCLAPSAALQVCVCSGSPADGESGSGPLAGSSCPLCVWHGHRRISATPGERMSCRDSGDPACRPEANKGLYDRNLGCYCSSLFWFTGRSRQTGGILGGEEELPFPMW